MNKTLILAAFTVQAFLAHGASSSDLKTVENSSTAKKASISDTSIAASIGVTSFALDVEGYEVGANTGMSVGANSAFSTGIENLDYEAGLQFLQTGGRQQGTEIDTGIEVDRKISLSYLAVPLGLRYKFLNLDSSQNSWLYFKGGVVPSALVDAKVTVTAFGETQETNLKDQTNSFDLMVMAGLGGTYDLGSDQAFLFELSYLRGTQKVIKEVNSYNEGLMASVMYSMGI